MKKNQQKLLLLLESMKLVEVMEVLSMYGLEIVTTPLEQDSEYYDKLNKIGIGKPITTESE